MIHHGVREGKSNNHEGHEGSRRKPVGPDQAFSVFEVVPFVDLRVLRGNAVRSSVPPKNLLHEAAGFTFGGAAYDQAIELCRWHSNADGYGLSILTASADAFVELQVVSHHRDSR